MPRFRSSTHYMKEIIAMKVNTYLNFGGNCAEAFKFYEQHLGAKNLNLLTQGQMPPGGPPIAPEMKDKVMHASLSIGKTTIMASDVPADRFQPIRSVYLCQAVDSDAEAERVLHCSRKAARCTCPCRRRSSPRAMGSAATASACPGWSFAKKRWERNRQLGHPALPARPTGQYQLGN